MRTLLNLTFKLDSVVMVLLNAEYVNLNSQAPEFNEYDNCLHY